MKLDGLVELRQKLKKPSRLAIKTVSTYMKRAYDSVDRGMLFELLEDRLRPDNIRYNEMHAESLQQ